MFRNGYRLLNNAVSSDITNPLKLFFQIVVVQLSYYLLALATFYLVAALNGYDFKIDWIFLWELISPENAMGWTLFLLWLFDSLILVVTVTFIVSRSKLAWDFAVTVHIINLLVVWLYTGKFPTLALWWCLQVISAAILVALSTYMTRWKELRTTFFNDMLDLQERGEVHEHQAPIEMQNMNESRSSS